MEANRALPALGRLTPKRSRALSSFLLGSHGLALAALAYSGLPRWAKGLFGLALLFHLALSWRRWVLLRGARALVSVVREGDGRWLLENGRGDQLGAELQGSFVSPWFVVLHLQALNGRVYVMTLPRDALAPDTFRRLRMQLLSSRGRARR